MTGQAISTHSIASINANGNMIRIYYSYTHRVKAKSTCKFGAHDKRLACLGVKEYSGKK